MSSPVRKFPVLLAIVGVAWGLSWFFARDIVKGLEALGVFPPRGLVFTDASDFAFSLTVLSILLCAWALWRVFATFGKRSDEPVSLLAEQDPRYVELIRQKDVLLRELKELDFDRQLRKISDEDFGSIERRLRKQATELLRALDELDPVRLYGDRIRADLQRYAGISAPTLRAAAGSSGADAAWREQVMSRPLYRELAPVLGERDLMLAALRDLWVVAAEVDRGDVAASMLTVEGPAGRSLMTLRALRELVLEELRRGVGDDGETLRLCALAGIQAETASSELRARSLAVLSREFGIGAAA